MVKVGYQIKRKLIIAAIVIGILMGGVFAGAGWARKVDVLDYTRTAWLESDMITHRGLHDNQAIPENSLTAFKKSVENGYIIELDVQLTADNQLVVFHDKKLKRIFGQEGYLKDTTYAELMRLKILDSAEVVPTFKQVLETVDGAVPILIEIKNEGQVGPTESLIYAELKDYQGHYAVQSFNPYSLQWYRDNAPEVLRGQLSGSFIITDYEADYAGTTRLPWYKRVLLSNLLLNFTSKPNFISYETENVDDDTLAGLRELDVPLLGWVIDDQAEYDRVKPYFDNFIVNTVDLR